MSSFSVDGPALCVLECTPFRDVSLSLQGEQAIAMPTMRKDASTWRSSVTSMQGESFLTSGADSALGLAMINIIAQW